MKRLYFIRAQMAYDTDTYYEAKTDVCVFGDQDGYAYWIDSLRRATTARRRSTWRRSPHVPQACGRSCFRRCASRRPRACGWSSGSCFAPTVRKWSW